MKSKHQGHGSTAYVSNKDCPECDSSLVQRIVLTAGDDSMPPCWKILGEPYCNDCHPKDDDDRWPMAVMTWELLGKTERKRIVSMIVDSVMNGTPTIYDELASDVEKSFDKFYGRLRKGMEKRSMRAVEAASLLEKDSESFG